MEVAPYQNISSFLTEMELEVAVILSELSELLRDPSDRPHGPPHLRWGARRRRRSPRLRSSSTSPSAVIPEDDPSPPSTSLPHRPRLDDETKGDAAAAAAATAVIFGSPSSPLFFPASGSEEPESHPPRPPPPPPPPSLPAPSIISGMKYSSKNSKHHNEMLKECSHMLTSLSAERSILHQEIEQYKINCTILKAENSLLIEHRSKLSENQIVLPKLPVDAPSADSAAEHRQPSPAKRNVEFDLNKLSEEAEAAAAAAEWEAAAAAAAESAHKAAKSAKARRRRMEIRRVKRIAATAAAATATAVSALGSMPSTVHKISRLR